MSQTFKLVVLLVALLAVLQVSASASHEESNYYVGIGDRLIRTFGPFYKQPLVKSDAEHQGWHQFGGADVCDENNYGFCYSKSKNGPTPAQPMVLCYTEASQISAYGVYAFGEPPAALVPKFWEPVSPGVYRTMMSLRNQSRTCSYQRDSAILGTRLSINQNFEIPLTQDAAEDAGWLMGNCIPKMGIHYSYNLSPAGTHSFELDTMVPAMPMYNPANGRVAAVLYLWPAAQNNGITGPWEGPFSNGLFCANWCKDSGCSFGDATISSMHWLYGDYAHVSCKANATCVFGQ
mmetsp:Transcript_13229/g.39980  ORF Transcript_13229/g.39980 Transcript_13229/m.39980 type:complete len:291 (+) Transcript_13229:159-1031(+)|eukprot:CAMPEP_0177686790 /NCGR_PEP_ID=MMETSP0447-20121125/33767_1 /TAXON_ID=0 /ORGANISM="Stygamoeba regulata, Strain BSH-02190019" /LENGTH=290 /DNA_ID=CAMNT_0019196957 /DNA_START=96 /DNA_END=968 /DNA_ORIENTATION=-